jgi:formiminoglutamase
MNKNQNVGKEKSPVAAFEVHYRAPDPALWRGRRAGAEDRPQYWYQVVESCDLQVDALPPLSAGSRGLVLLGYAVDEGVRRNQGRPGAAAGPAAIRGQLGRLAWHGGAGVCLFDTGDIHCPDGNLPAAQEALAAVVEYILTAGYFPVVLGGGHDMAYGHGRGVRQYCAQAHPGARIGIINCDAHFDLRRPAAGPTSGTPFYQLATESVSPADFRYCVVGIQAAANPPELFATAERYGVEVISAQAVNLSGGSELRDAVRRFAAECDRLYLTIDLDGFSAAHAPGVSAPSPVGLAPEVVLELLAALMATGKVTSMDIAELNPRFDLDDRTARLAARLVYAAVAAQWE